MIFFTSKTTICLFYDAMIITQEVKVCKIYDIGNIGKYSINYISIGLINDKVQMLNVKSISNDLMTRLRQGYGEASTPTQTALTR